MLFYIVTIRYVQQCRVCRYVQYNPAVPVCLPHSVSLVTIARKQLHATYWTLLYPNICDIHVLKRWKMSSTCTS